MNYTAEVTNVSISCCLVFNNCLVTMHDVTRHACAVCSSVEREKEEVTCHVQIQDCRVSTVPGDPDWVLWYFARQIALFCWSWVRVWREHRLTAPRPRPTPPWEMHLGLPLPSKLSRRLQIFLIVLHTSLSSVCLSCIRMRRTTRSSNKSPCRQPRSASTWTANLQLRKYCKRNGCLVSTYT